jgi:hypothetical protein
MLPSRCSWPRKRLLQGCGEAIVADAQTMFGHKDAMVAGRNRNNGNGLCG